MVELVLLSNTLLAAVWRKLRVRDLADEVLVDQELVRLGPLPSLHLLALALGSTCHAVVRDAARLALRL